MWRRASGSGADSGSDLGWAGEPPTVVGASGCCGACDAAQVGLIENNMVAYAIPGMISLGGRCEEVRK
jgi:hypothetical protein